MRFSTSRLLALTLSLTLPTTFASVCDGECMAAITNAFLKNYTLPIHNVLSDLTKLIVTELTPNMRSVAPPISYFVPMLAAYQKTAYDDLETAIFPSYFNGKCQNQQTGVELVDCLIHDCPVVCESPASMIQYYSTLRLIAYNTTLSTLQRLATPGSGAYEEVERAILADSEIMTRRPLRWERRGAKKEGGHLLVAQTRRANRARDVLKAILAQLSQIFETTCGGSTTATTNGLPKCSWEVEMKGLLSTFL